MMGLLLLIAGIGLATGFLSGMLGIGGGIIMAPLLLYVPPLFGFAPLPMRVVAGLTLVQGLAACLAGGVMHHRFRYISGPLSLCMGISIFIASLIGGAGAGYVSNRLLLFIFACLAFAAAILMFVPPALDSDRPEVGQLGFSRGRAVISAAGVGLLGGMVGQGGSFILIPLMTSFVRIPTRIALGSNLVIVMLATLAGFIGKAVTGQIAWPLTLPVVLSVVPAAALGGYVSGKVAVRNLRLVLALVIALTAVRIWYALLTGG